MSCSTEPSTLRSPRSGSTQHASQHAFFGQRILSRTQDDRGTALVELAIALPFLTMALLWSIRLADVGLLRIRAVEAARWAAWESAARPSESPRAIDAEFQQAFVSAPAFASDSSRRRGRRSSRKGPLFSTSAVAWSLSLSERSDQVSGSSLSRRMLEALGVPPGSQRVARVELEAPDRLLPEFAWLGVAARGTSLDRPSLRETFAIFSDGSAAVPSADVSAHQLPVETEREVARRIGRVAFAGLAREAGLAGAAASLLDRLGLPSPFAIGTGQDGGPVSLLPARPPAARFVPRAPGAPTVRYGEAYATARAAPPGQSGDGPRHTVPAMFRPDRWLDDGGVQRASDARAARIAREVDRPWDCRGPWFLGSRRSDRIDHTCRVRGKGSVP